MSANWIKSRQTQFGLYATLYICIVIAVLGAANWLGGRHNKSVDTTANKRFSLADQTQKVVKGLQQDVRILYFEETARFPQGRDLLDRYKNLNPGRLTIDYIDPTKKPQLAREYNIRVQGTAVVQAGEKREEARAMSEEEITSALIRALKEGQKTVCFLEGFGERSINEPGAPNYSGARQQLERNNYQARSINLLEDPKIPEDCAIIATGGPRQAYPPAIASVIRDFVEIGGRALIMIDPPMSATATRIARQEALEEVLASWGVTLKRNLVLSMGRELLQGVSPEVAIASDYGSHPIVRDMRGGSAAFPLTQSLEVKPTDQTSVERLGSTSKTSLAVAGEVGTLKESDIDKGEPGSHILSAAGVYRTGQEGIEGRFVVTGTSEFIADRSMRILGNSDLFLNMINWLSSDEDLISIRPKDPEDRRIQLSQGQMFVVRMVSQFVIPLGIILAGVFVWWRRR
jgi:ABC-type uncharacterized transport system involved in gliding motility auxiliary subunit